MDNKDSENAPGRHWALTDKELNDLRTRAEQVAAECADLVSFHEGTDGGPVTVRAGGDDVKALAAAAQAIGDLLAALTQGERMADSWQHKYEEYAPVGSIPMVVAQVNGLRSIAQCVEAAIEVVDRERHAAVKRALVAEAALTQLQPPQEG